MNESRNRSAGYSACFSIQCTEQQTVERERERKSENQDKCVRGNGCIKLWKYFDVQTDSNKPYENKYDSIIFLINVFAFIWFVYRPPIIVINSIWESRCVSRTNTYIARLVLNIFSKLYCFKHETNTKISLTFTCNKLVLRPLNRRKFWVNHGCDTPFSHKKKYKEKRRKTALTLNALHF